MSFDQMWANADPDAAASGDDLEPPADGTYIVALLDAAAFTSKKGDAFVKLNVANPADQYTWTVLLGFKSEGQANLTKKQVRELGIDVDNILSLDALDTALKDKVGGFFSVTVKTNGKFRNTFVDGPATTATSDVPTDLSDFQPAATVGADNDDVPF